MQRIISGLYSKYSSFGVCTKYFHMTHDNTCCQPLCGYIWSCNFHRLYISCWRKIQSIYVPFLITVSENWTKSYHILYINYFQGYNDSILFVYFYPTRLKSCIHDACVHHFNYNLSITYFIACYVLCSKICPFLIILKFV